MGFVSCFRRRQLMKSSYLADANVTIHPRASAEAE